VTGITFIGLNLCSRNADRKTVNQKTQRINERNLCAELIKIVWTDGSGGKQKELAALEDISPGGACLQVEHPIPVNTPISILYPEGRYHGRIRYCVFQHTGYFLGIQFDPGYQWSKRQYMPSHLLEIHSVRSKKS
jgi:hypothetical protein